MDVALCLELLRQADHSGAADTIVLNRNIDCHRDVWRGGKKSMHREAIHETDLFVRVENGCTRVKLLQGEGGLPSRESLIQMTKNAIQAARLANIWGQNGNPLDEAIHRFENSAMYSVDDLRCVADDKPKTKSKKKEVAEDNGCIGECFRLECFGRENISFAEMLNQIAKNIQKSTSGARLNASVTASAIEETLYHHDEIKTQKRLDIVVEQEISVEHQGETTFLRLPEYRSSEPVLDLSSAQMLRASDVADKFEKSVCAQTEYNNDASGILLMGWPMAVLGHEAHHLGADMTSSGKIIFDSDRCSQAISNASGCRSQALDVPESEKKNFDAVISELPDKTLILDAPSSWIRRNRQWLDVKFEIVCGVSGGKVSEFYKACVVRFDLLKMWEQCRFAAYPVVRIALKCGNGISNFQAPAAYFEPGESILLSAF